VVAGVSPVTVAVTEAVLVTGEGVAAVVMLVARVGLVPCWKLGTVDVDPTVRVPFKVADVAVSCVAAFVVTLTAVFQLERFDAVKLPPSAASRATSSLAS
jgi:hypothetical protein